MWKLFFDFMWKPWKITNIFWYSKKVQDLMRAGVIPCTLLVHECNAGNIISTETCLGAFIGKKHALK